MRAQLAATQVFDTFKSRLSAGVADPDGLLLDATMTRIEGLAAPAPDAQVSQEVASTTQACTWTWRG